MEEEEADGEENIEKKNLLGTYVENDRKKTDKKRQKITEEKGSSREENKSNIVHEKRK